jgi:hypothetical protein
MFLDQPPFTIELIQGMLTSPRRRQITEEWEALKEPKEADKDWSLRLPLKPYTRAFDEVFVTKISHIGWRDGANYTYWTYLKGLEKGDLQEIREWLRAMESWVGIRDCLPISFALDFDRKDGDPTKERTEIGALREAAKPYDKPAKRGHHEAARELAKRCVRFLERVKCYDSLNAVLAIPPSKPTKAYHLSSVIASHVAKDWGRDDLSYAVEKLFETEQIKNLPLEKKLEVLKGSIKATSEVGGRKILLLDDLYQSGITMNYVAMLLLGEGAKKVYGLACEKTCSNDDNIS